MLAKSSNLSMDSLILDSPLLPILIGLFALAIGSFLNVVIYRLPRILEQDWQAACNSLLNPDQQQTASTNKPFNLALPASHCPHCQHPLSIWDNIPLLSFIYRKGKCAYCHKAISYQYPIVELLSVIITLLSFSQFGLTLTFALAALFGWLLIVLAVIDCNKRLLPDQLTLSLLWAGLLANSFNLFTDLHSAVFGAAAGYLLLWSIYWLFKYVTGKEGIGQGDFKLLAALGACCGWQALLFILLVSSIIGLLFSILEIIIQRKDNATLLIPYGLYLAIAGWLYLLWGDTILAWYLS